MNFYTIASMNADNLGIQSEYQMFDESLIMRFRVMRG